MNDIFRNTNPTLASETWTLICKIHSRMKMNACICVNNKSCRGGKPT